MGTDYLNIGMAFTLPIVQESSTFTQADIISIDNK